MKVTLQEIQKWWKKISKRLLPKNINRFSGEEIRDSIVVSDLFDRLWRKNCRAEVGPPIQVEEKDYQRIMKALEITPAKRAIKPKEALTEINDLQKSIRALRRQIDKKEKEYHARALECAELKEVVKKLRPPKKKK